MKFDVVIGNPPYNNGMDVDFIFLGDGLSKNSSIFITPAKGLCAADPNHKIISVHSYGDLQKKIVPRINEVHYYPDSVDIFAARVFDGIAVYNIVKRVQDKCKIVNRCVLQKKIDTTMNRDIKNDTTLWNIGSELINYLGDYTRFKFDFPTLKKYKINIDRQYSTGGLDIKEKGSDGHWYIKPEAVGSGGNLFSKAGAPYVITPPRVLLYDQKSPSGCSDDVFWSDSLTECQSFSSFVSSKFVRFFLLINIGGLGVALKDYSWRFVPAPDILPSGEFDWSHIYTDEYLYKKYNLPQKYVDIIESVIKTRDISDVLSLNENDF